jgi:hypothetical protein
MAIIKAPAHAKSVHDAVCFAFNLSLTCADFQIKLRNCDGFLFETVQFDELFDGQYFDVGYEDGCYTFTPDAMYA